MNDSSIQKFFYKKNSTLQNIEGINNLSITKNISFSDYFMLGGVESSTQINAPEQVEVSFDRTFIKMDDLFEYTGKNPISNAYIYNGEKYYNINNLYLNTYSAAFTVGELPKINTKFTSYGSDIYENITPENTGFLENKSYDIPRLNSIFITGSSSDEIKNIHNIFSFDYSLEINRQPYYGIGFDEPTEVCEILPIKINFSVNSKMKNEKDNLTIAKYKQNNLDFDIFVSGVSGSMNFPIRKAQLLNFDLTMSNQNTLEIKRQFVGYYGLR
jgi:hypothetical protein